MNMRLTTRVLVAVALLFAPGAQPLMLQAPLRGMARTPMAARVAPLHMQEGGDREREKSRGKTAVIARPKPKPVEKNREEVEKEGSWRVLLHNDDVSCSAATHVGCLSRLCAL